MEEENLSDVGEQIDDMLDNGMAMELEPVKNVLKPSNNQNDSVPILLDDLRQAQLGKEDEKSFKIKKRSCQIKGHIREVLISFLHESLTCPYETLEVLAKRDY